MYTRTTNTINIEGVYGFPLDQKAKFLSQLYDSKGNPVDGRAVLTTTTSQEFLSTLDSWMQIVALTDGSPKQNSVTYEGLKPEIPVRYFFSKKPKGSSNFKKECNDGIIVYHPYQVHSGFVRSSEIWTQLSSRVQEISLSGDSALNNWFRQQDYLRSYRVGGFTSTFQGLQSLGSSRAFVINNPNIRFPLVRTTSILSTVPLDGALATKFEEDCSLALLRMDDAIVTEALSKANDKELDLLTTLAEMPKTLQSIVDGFHLLADMTKAAKRREMELTKSHTKFLMNTRKRKDAEIFNTNRKKRRKRPINNSASYKRWKDQNEQKFASETAVELVDAITGVWMNYRYNIRPIVYTIQDSVSVVEKWKRQYLTVRSVHTRDLDPPEIEGYTFSGTSKITHRCWIKRRYDVSDDWNNFTKVIMGDIFVTAYELIPVWSIVADWFFNIGPALRAASYNPVHKQEAATYSVKVEVKGNYYLNSDPSVNYDVKYSGYKRKSISPSQHISLRYVNEFDDLKGYDSLSFLWAAIRGPVKKLPQPYRRQ